MVKKAKEKSFGIDVELKALGKNGSGKTRLLSLLKGFLENEGMTAKLDNKDEHKLIVRS